jgi:hypothetical protein
MTFFKQCSPAIHKQDRAAQYRLELFGFLRILGSREAALWSGPDPSMKFFLV